MAYIPDEKNLNVNCSAGGACTADFTVKTLTVNFPGVTVSNIWVRTPGTNSDVVTPLGAKTGSATTNVLADTYDVWVQQGIGAYEKKLNVDCTASGPCTADYGVATLTVPFAGFSGVDVWVRVPDGTVCAANGGTAIQASGQTEQAVFKVLQDRYDVIMRVGGQYYTYDNIDCTGATCKAQPTLTVNFPGLSRIHTYIKKSDGMAGKATGADVANQTYKNNPAVFTTLAPGKYDVVVVQGAMNKVIDDVMVFGSCASVDNIVKTMTVNFLGISNVHTYVKVNDDNPNTASGGAVDERTYKTDKAELVVLKNTYDVVVVKNAKQLIVNAVDCTDTGTCTVDNIVATLTIQFPGLTSVHAYVKLVDDKPGEATGGDVDNRTYQSNSTSLVVLRNYYDVLLVKNGGKGVADNVNCMGATCTLAGSNLQINAPAGTTVQVKHYTSGAMIASGTVASNQWVTFSNLAIGIYDIVLTQGANTVTLQDKFHIAGATIDMLNVLQVNAPAGTKMDVLKPGGAVAGGTVASNQWVTLYLLKDTYDLRLTQGAKVKDVTGVNCAGDNTSLDQLSVLNVNAPAGTKVKIYVPGTTNEATSGTVASNQWVTLYVVSDTYNVFLKQNAAEKTLDVNIASDKDLYELCTLQVKATAGTVISVYVTGTTDLLVTSGTVASNQWVTLYVVQGTYDVSNGTTTKSADCNGASATVTFP